jgi:hypothetical protein
MCPEKTLAAHRSFYTGKEQGMKENRPYKVDWDNGSLELQTRQAAVHLVESFLAEGQQAKAYTRDSADQEWVKI